MKTRILGILLSSILLSAPLMGHPGHGDLSLPPESVFHYAFEPIHLLPAVGLGLTLYYTIRAIRWIGVRRCQPSHER